MMDNELKNIWKQARTQELVQLNHDKLITEMEHAHKTTEQAIKKRDRREIIVAYALMPLFLILGIKASEFLTQLGAFLMIPVLGFIIYKLKSVKKYKPASVNTPSQTYLEQLKLYYTMEMDLLKDVLYWYLIPPGICVSLIYWGISDTELEKYLSIGVMILMYTGIYFMNQAAVKKRYIPLLKSIEDSLAAFKKD